MVKSHCDETPDEFEVMQVVGIDIRSGVDLKTVVVLVGVLEEAIHRIKDLVREEEEPFPEITETF